MLRLIKPTALTHPGVGNEPLLVAHRHGELFHSCKSFVTLVLTVYCILAKCDTETRRTLKSWGVK